MAFTPEERKRLLDVRLNESAPQDEAWELSEELQPNHPAGDPTADQVLRDVLAAKKQRRAAAAETPVPAEGTQTPLPAVPPAASVSLAQAAGLPEKAVDEMTASETAADTRSKLRRGFDRFLYAMGTIVPKRGDGALEVIRKCVFMVALVTLIGSLSYILNVMVVRPWIDKMDFSSVSTLYDPQNPQPAPDDVDYPAGISEAFKALYAKNNDVRGYIRYQDTDQSWLNIDYPVMFSGDNEYYLNHNFHKARTTAGSIFFDQRTKLESPEDVNRILIAYGHNMASGYMFAPLNQFLNNNLTKARSAPLITLDTLYEQGQYKVFSIMLLSTRDEDGPYFDYLIDNFASDEEFMAQVAQFRARSLYDYNSVDVNERDELLILSTCTAPSGAKFEEGRCVVVARKVREGESAEVDTSQIVTNTDALMPLAWYLNQKLTPHAYYDGYPIPDNYTTTTTAPVTDPPTTPPTTPPTDPPTTPPSTPPTSKPTTKPPTDPPTTPPSTEDTDPPTTPPSTDPTDPTVPSSDGPSDDTSAATVPPTDTPPAEEG